MTAQCVIIGDSIGRGIASAMPGCASQTTVGISAARFDVGFDPVGDAWTVISLGSNPGPHDAASLADIRARVSGRVVWMLPPARDRDLIAAIAASNGDLVVDVRLGGATPERIHPDGAGYRRLAQTLEGIIQ